MNPYNPTEFERMAEELFARVLVIVMVALVAFQAGKLAESALNPFDGEMQDYTTCATHETR